MRKKRMRILLVTSRYESMENNNSVVLVYEPTTYRQSDRRLLAKLVPMFADSGVSRNQRDGSLRP
jgi:hypothetical protein